MYGIHAEGRNKLVPDGTVQESCIPTKNASNPVYLSYTLLASSSSAERLLEQCVPALLHTHQGGGMPSQCQQIDSSTFLVKNP